MRKGGGKTPCKNLSRIKTEKLHSSINDKVTSTAKCITATTKADTLGGLASSPGASLAGSQPSKSHPVYPPGDSQDAQRPVPTLRLPRHHRPPPQPYTHVCGDVSFAYSRSVCSPSLFFFVFLQRFCSREEGKRRQSISCQGL